MKKLFMLLLCFCVKIAYCQQAVRINGEDAIKHIGEVVRVHDSLISGRIYKDSTAVLEFGESAGSHHFTVLFIAGKMMEPPNIKLINFFKDAKSTIEGLLLSINGSPTIVLHDLKNVRTDYHPQ